MITLSISLDLSSAKWKKAFPKMEEKIEQAVAASFLHAKKPSAFSERNFEVAVTLADDKAMTDLNHTYRGKKTSTNVLSFPQFKMKGLTARVLDSFPDQDAIPLGDVVLAHGTVKKECKEQDKTIENHVIHLVVHGTLHLLGYDHMKNRDATSMEKLECAVLESLGYPDPYNDAAPAPKAKPKMRRAKKAAVKKKAKS